MMLLVMAGCPVIPDRTLAGDASTMPAVHRCRGCMQHTHLISICLHDNVPDDGAPDGGGLTFCLNFYCL
eukprot:m.9740 g.9740  ORF g.9740 m.9740 type:complete len:69 (-) comp6988_c0_seq1:3291-3497(-)